MAADEYCSVNFVDTEDDEGNLVPGLWRQNVEPVPNSTTRRIGSNNSTRRAIQLRDILKEYFMNSGRISKQNKII